MPPGCSTSSAGGPGSDTSPGLYRISYTHFVTSPDTQEGNQDFLHS